MEFKNYSTTVDRIITSGQILVFEVSKQPYQSAQQDKIICNWHHCLPGVQYGIRKLSQSFEDGYCCSRCLNNHIKVPNIKGSFASGTTTSLVAKNGTKKNIPLLWIKSSKKPQIKKFHKTDPQKWEF